MNLKEEIKERLTKKRPTRVFSYIHLDGRIGVLLEIEADTDFALKTSELEIFAHEVCLQVAAMNPVSVDSYDCEARSIAYHGFDDEVVGKPAAIREKIVNGKLAKWDKEHLLLSMSWVKDNDLSIGDLLTELCQNLREDIKIVRFARFGK